MGMDVYGKNPSGPKGEYFRRNVWGWHPLWDLIEEMVPWVPIKVASGHTNDGYGLDADDAAALAATLKGLLDSGQVAEYIEKRDHHLADMPDIPCEYCGATGTRTDEVGVKMGMDKKHWCNACDGKGTQQDPRRAYQVSIQDVAEFAEFVRQSGGFSIY